MSLLALSIHNVYVFGKCFYFVEMVVTVLGVELTNKIQDRNRNFIAISVVSFFYLFAWSAAMSFFVIWLGQSEGIGSAQTGILYSANSLMALVMQPIFGFVSDKIGLRKGLLFGILILVLPIGPFFIYLYGPLLRHTFWLGAILGGLYLGMIFNAGYGAIDSFMDKISRKYGFEYGRCRMWGSLGWAVATFVAGRAINISPNINFLLASGAAVVAILALSLTKIKLSEIEIEKAESVKLKDTFSLVKNVRFLILLLFMIGVGCIYDVYDQQFATYFVSQFKSAAIGNKWFGDLGSIQTIFEALFLAVAPFICKRLGAKRTLLLAGIIMSVRIFGSSLQFGPLWIGIMKCIHSFEKPLFLVAQFKYIALNFDLRLSSSVYLGCMFTSSAMSVMLAPLFGVMYATIGFSTTYMIIGITAGICTILSSFLLTSDKKALNFGNSFAEGSVNDN
ncbi:oligosaccharide MFS transporter [Pediococcus acidilactici]|uniref:Oligosaccharide MFS transporter n=1 Tax=Pediococcus acidilactici TaxID=1254 RepID=A0AAW8YEI9_PEDAC|nr:oligosaccharide MFS transporter [Pediococcus acidilactici]KRN91751.1 lacY protein [Pediococcus acidilactici]MDV2620425.1 oligosaccharide MFS transporter [Pediococcus acidilactici]QYI93933.1 oligosaccharide MFS transporter [Pediococcus acidilactici]